MNHAIVENQCETEAASSGNTVFSTENHLQRLLAAADARQMDDAGQEDSNEVPRGRSRTRGEGQGRGKKQSRSKNRDALEQQQAGSQTSPAGTISNGVDGTAGDHHHPVPNVRPRGRPPGSKKQRGFRGFSGRSNSDA
jgi:hypothetical protein